MSAGKSITERRGSAFVLESQPSNDLLRSSVASHLTPEYVMGKLNTTDAGQKALEKLTFVIPFRQSLDRPDALYRLYCTVRYLQNACPISTIVVSDQSLPAPASVILPRAQNIRHKWRPKRVYSPATCKNTGADASSTSYLLFLDIDVLPTAHMIRTLSRIISDQSIDFIWFPVHFLKNDHSDHSSVAKILLGNPDPVFSNVEQVGYATGIQLFSQALFQELDGYSTTFRGYGCEDMEMIHRASIHTGLMDPSALTSDYLEDYRTKHRAQYRGFRKIYAETIEQLLDVGSVYCTHTWHKRRNKRSFRKMRAKNDAILYDKMRKDIRSSE